MIFFVHTGKTGGTELKRQVRALFAAPKLKEPQVINDQLVLLNHCSLDDAIKKFGDPSGLIITYRDPAERFVSGFYCRQRMGLPHHKSVWDAQEAAAFAHFRTANELAEALSDEDPARVAAAHFAMKAIRHIRRGYAYHFGDLPSFIMDYSERVLMCSQTDALDLELPKTIRDLAPDPQRPHRPEKRADPVQYAKGLSPRGLSNLQSFWQTEYAFYELFRSLSDLCSGRS